MAQKSQTYNLFQEIPFEISQTCQSAQNTDLEFVAKIFWLISLKGNETTALSFIHVDPELLKNSSDQTLFAQQTQLLKHSILPQNSIISGIIAAVETLEISPEQQEIHKNLQKLAKENNTEQIFTSHLPAIITTPLCYPTNKEWKEQVEVDCESQPFDIKLVKYQDVSDILKQYSSLALYIKTPQNTNNFEGLISHINENLVEFTVEDQNFSLKEEEAQEDEPKQQQQKGKKGKKAPKQKKGQKQESPAEKLFKIVQATQDKYKTKAQELSKNCPAFIRHYPIELGVKIPEFAENQEEKPEQAPENIEIEVIIFHKNSDLTQDSTMSLIKDLLQTTVPQQLKQHLITQKITKQNFFSLEKQALPPQLPPNHSKIDPNFTYHMTPVHQFFTPFNHTQNMAKYSEFKAEKLKNVDRYLQQKPMEDGKTYKVFGNYVFHHYKQDGFNDQGWGCAYRSCMSVVSWFIENGYVSEDKVKIPSIQEIQKMLIEMGDKDASFLNSSQWIGAFEVSYILNKLIDIDCKMLHLGDGSEINSLLGAFKEHFVNEGTPVMFGGAQYAYTLMGIDYDEDMGEAKFLILDPHYVGADQFKNAAEKDGISWKKADLFKEGEFYNFCCPVRPRNN